MKKYSVFLMLIVLLAPYNLIGQQSNVSILTSQGYFVSDKTNLDKYSYDPHKLTNVEHPKGLKETVLLGNFNIYRVRILMGEWDLNGDGNLQKVYNCAPNIEIEQPGGSYRAHYLGTNWALMEPAISDLDGKPGSELIFNMGKSVKVIRDRDCSTSEYQICDGSWALMGASDTDGATGNELIFNMGKNIKIIRDRDRSTGQYEICDGSWALLLNGINETDGIAGNEICFNIGLTGIKIVTDKERSTRVYSIGSVWVLIKFTDDDGKPGNEILYRGNYGLWAICHARKTTYKIE